MSDDQTANSIAIVISDLGGGGAQRVVSNLVPLWQSTGRRVTVITFASDESDFFPMPADVGRIVIGLNHPSNTVFAAIMQNLRRVIRLRRALKQSGAVSVISFIGTTNILSVLATRWLGVGVVISERNDPARQRLGGPWDAFRRYCYGRADVVTANSHDALAAMARYVPSERLRFVPNPVIPPAGTSPAELPFRAILSVGRLTYQKGHDVLLRAFARIADKIPDWGLVILGEGSLEQELRALVIALGIEARVIWVGLSASPWKYYAAAEIFALPSRFEGTPNALLEAMSMGIASIVTDSSGGAREAVERGPSGLVVATDDPESLADAMLRLISDSGLRRELGDAGRDDASAFGADPVLAAWDRVLGSCESRARSGG